MTEIPSEADMAMIRDASTKTLGLPLLQPGASRSQAPPWFYQRFGDNGHALDSGGTRITTEESERLFEQRRDGLRVLFINAPIREWSYPNILPIGHAYVGAVAAIDGHRSEEHTSELQSPYDLVCRLLLEKKKKNNKTK